MQNFVHDLLSKEECFAVVGLCMKIQSKLGKGFKEVVYKDALEIEMRKTKLVVKEKDYLASGMMVSFCNIIL